MRNCPFRTAKSEAQNVCKMIISIRRVGNLNNERIEVPNWVACALQLLVRKSESCTIMGGTFHTCDLPQLLQLEAGKNEREKKYKTDLSFKRLTLYNRKMSPKVSLTVQEQQHSKKNKKTISLPC